MRPVIFLDFDGVLRPLPPRGRLCTPKHLTQRVIGSVPAGKSRPEKIRAWLQAHPRPCWISLDDLPMEEHFPQHADTTAGVLDEDAYARACAFLQRQR